MADDIDLDLEPGDFLYQTDQELFLVVLDEQDESYTFSVHGWRDIGKERLSGYVDGQHGKLYRQEDFEDVVEDEADENIADNYDRLKELFEQYSNGVPDDDPSEDFAMEDHE